MRVSKHAPFEALGLSIPRKLSDEKKMWGLVTDYVYFANEDSGAKLDRYRKREAAGQPDDRHEG